MSNNTAVLVTSAAGLGAVALLSVPAVLNLGSLRNRGPKLTIEGYEDKDGKSTPEAVKAFSNKLSKSVLLFFSVAGLGVSLALAIISTLDARGIQEGVLFLENWLDVMIWVSLPLHI